MPQARQQQARQRAQVAGAAAAAGTAVRAGGAAALAPDAIAAAGSAGVSVATAGILAAFVSFLAAVREQHRAWLAKQLGGYGLPSEIAAVIRQEMFLEEQFARNAADRLASSLPQALRISDPAERQARVRQLLSDEQRYASMRAEAMAARAIGALARTRLRVQSPLGAFWRLGHAQKHTPGCLVMADKFWPWAVLDRLHPPRHYGCTSSLHSYADAILEGWMRPSDVPDTREAIRAASGVMMEGEADALIMELELRDRLLERGASAEALSVIEWKGVGRDGSPNAV